MFIYTTSCHCKSTLVESKQMELSLEWLPAELVKEGLCLSRELVPGKVCAYLWFLLVVRSHLLAIHSSTFLLIWNEADCKGKETNSKVTNFCQSEQVHQLRRLVSGFLSSILIKTSQLVLLFFLSSRNIAHMSSSPSHSLTEVKLVSLATTFATLKGNFSVCLTWRLEPSLRGPAALFCL